MAAKKVIRVVAVVAVVAGASLWGMHYWKTGRWQESTNNAYLRADISVITPRVGGEIIEVAVRDNQLVKRGDVLVRIDPRDYEAKLANARAVVAQAEAALVSNKSSQAMQAAMVDEARATLFAAQADRVRVRKDLDRANALVKDGVATTARLDIAAASAKSADASILRGEAGVKAAQAQGGSMTADRARLEAQLDAARAAEALATLDFESTTIRAPLDSRVGDLSAKLGARVNAGLRLVSLVAAGPVWVEANFKETQLTHMVAGQKVKVTVDAFSAHEIDGVVDSVSPASGAEFALLPPDNATGNFTKIVQRVPVKVLLAAPPELADKLRAGMSVEAVVDTKPAT